MDGVAITLEAVPGFDQLAQEWQQLEASSEASFFTSWAWIGAWVASLPDARVLKLLRARQHNRTVGLGLFGEHVGAHVGPVRARGLFLHASGDAKRDNLTIEYNDLLVDKDRADAVRRAVLQELPRLDRGWEELHLPGVAPGRAWSAFDAPGYTQMVRQSQTFQVDLNAVRARGGDYLGMLSANTRSQIRRSMKEYEKLGPLALDLPQDLEQALASFDAMARLHESTWAERGEPGAFADPYFREFHRRLIRDQFASGGVQLMHVHAGAHTVGYLYHFVARGRVCNYQSGFDYALGGKHGRPGLVAHALAVQACARAGLQVYDMMAGEYRYKESLATETGSLEWRIVRRNKLKFRVEETMRTLKDRVTPKAAPAAMQTAASEQALIALESDWRALEVKAILPTQQHAFIRTAAQRFVKPGALRVFALRADGELKAIAPMCRSGGFAPRLEFIGAAGIGEPCDMLHADAQSATALAEALVRSGEPLRLERVPADSVFVEALTRAMHGRGKCKIRPTNPAPTIALDAQWAAPEMQFNAGRRSDFRRARRNAEKYGAVNYEVLTPRLDQLDALLDEAVAVEMKSWKGRDGTALGADPVRGPFFREYARTVCAQGILRPAFLRIDGRAIGVQIALEWDQRFWLFKIGYDENYGRCSPGGLLMLHTLKYAAERGLRAYELLGSAEPWTATWTQAQHGCVMIHTYPHGVAGWRAFAADAACWGAAKLHGVFGRAQPLRRLRAARSATVQWVVRRCARAYVAGPALADARAACMRLHDEGHANTVGYFNGDDESPRTIANADIAAIDMLAAERLDAYLSVKVPAFKFDAALLREIAEGARGHGIGLHFDAHAPEDADHTFEAVRASAAVHVATGCTLPGRWRRSVDDALRVKDLPLRVRIVKGQWADPVWPDADLREGYLAVVDALAGRTACVAVATHDPVLARTALQRLKAAGTPCELELLYGLPTRAALAVAREPGVPARVYVPFGTAWLPYALGHARRKPGMVFWVLCDALQGMFGRP